MGSSHHGSGCARPARLLLRLLAGCLIALALLAVAQTSARELRTTELMGGGFNVAQGHSLRHGQGPIKRFIVEVEESLNIRAKRFATKVQNILFDRRSWIRSKTFSLKRVDSSPAAFRVTLATRSTTDRLCYPLPTNGSYSCWNGSRAVINVWRWRNGAKSYGDHLKGYRRYLINHEVGHGLGHSHRNCPRQGDKAPVMLQQTIGLQGCRRNPWPKHAELP
ncbi:MAG: DUF3152 domain-containing protein [Actinomycetota bacterium]|nr:DUF3152 domain-containing protein [Actinomycetota bacterium]